MIFVVGISMFIGALIGFVLCALVCCNNDPNREGK